MKQDAAETLLGAVVVAVAALFFVFALRQDDRGGAPARDAMPVYALFNRVDGVAKGADVRMAGVKIGVVTDVSLTENNAARLDFAVSRAHQIPIDTVARIQTDGLLGGAYVALEPGAGIAFDEAEGGVLKEGGELRNTAGTVDLTTALSGLVDTMQQTLREVQEDRAERRSGP